MNGQQMLIAFMGFLLIGLSLHEYWPNQLKALV